MQKYFHTILIKTYNTYLEKLRPYMVKCGLSSGQPKILSFLKINNNCLQKDLASNYNIEPATVSKLLNNMEEKQLIKREVPKQNRRITNITITEKGIDSINEFEIYRDKIEDAALSDFSNEEKEMFINFLNRIYNNLNKIKD